MSAKNIWIQGYIYASTKNESEGIYPEYVIDFQGHIGIEIGLRDYLILERSLVFDSLLDFGLWVSTFEVEMLHHHHINAFLDSVILLQKSIEPDVNQAIFDKLHWLLDYCKNSDAEVVFNFEFPEIPAPE